MIDYSNYNLSEMQAIVTVLGDLTDEMSIVQGYEQDFHIALAEYLRANAKALQLMKQMAEQAEQARDHAVAEAEKVNRIKEACVAGAPPAEAPVADPPTPPDMFGWVGDALDGLEVKLSD